MSKDLTTNICESFQCSDIHTPESLDIIMKSRKVEADRSQQSSMHIQLSASQLSEGVHRSNAMSATNTTGNAETAGIDAKLSLFFADSRLARCGSH
jgi:hypothetical protein